MSTVIELLEKLGQDANLQNIENLTPYINNTEISEELKAAILAKDEQQISQYISNLPLIKFVAITTPDDGDDDEEESEEPKEAIAR